MSIVFYGTDEFAATILNRICESSDFKILCVITRPDRPSGRKNEIVYSPVKIIAEKYNLEILQPDSLKEFDSEHLHKANLAVVAEYGLIIPERLLNYPISGTINLHGSILPRYRGASPIQTAILSGEDETGVTLMLMDKKMDHGPIISSVKTAIGKDELFGSLYMRLANSGAELFLNDAKKYIDGKITAISQDETAASYCKILNRDDGKIDFSKSAREIYDKYRAYTPWPGIWALYNGKRIKLGKISISETEHQDVGAIRTSDDRIFIGCGNNSVIEVTGLQQEGKKMLSAKDFLMGDRNFGTVNFN